MGKTDKQLTQLACATNTFVWQELVSLLGRLGYEEREMAGSRVRFYQAELDHIIMLHRPHPENYIKGGALKAVKEALTEVGFL